MKFEHALIHEKGWRNLAYQLEAMVDKAPELKDDFDNLTWLIVDMISTLEQKAEDQFNDGYNEGQADGYREASYEYGEEYERGYDDGHRDGFEEGFKDSVQTV